ncbi:hypothetical protein J2S17_005288 [Cytobacillus purgationiresistens]|uniref:Uncharacterized protein n=1 Tax=Cytobacillus purgationiresistens TaxID=863449 RepID=A0ABU0APZ0_9BACI|nr:hypothetical protein [Cytobacillus purgationiresistens]
MDGTTRLLTEDDLVKFRVRAYLITIILQLPSLSLTY